MIRLRKLRQEKKLSLKEVSEELKRFGLNISPDGLAKYERGDREPKLETWQKLAEFFGVSVQYLQGISDVPNANSSLAAQTSEALLQSIDDETLDKLADKNLPDEIPAETKKELVNTLKSYKAILSLQGDSSLDATGVTKVLQEYYLVIQQALRGDEEAKQAFSEISQVLNGYIQNQTKKLNSIFDELSKKSEKKSKKSSK
ncbi:helix-turn-helix domain-containing protein [Lactobacillus gasseri]|uniref:Toxin-antitoxin system, antitoxin component, Xre family n=1 Tax=Lactobacillus gasseri SV-16A-US TaxID=575604 RepID=A0AB34P3M5_LACGS|nr:helix-turn-helix transcriptional regulator [Lactobacillus gasseri]KFL98207.1 toxin-antitoxin system, antitoxin component, Xre family [Lactobacillus gasseri SV-16A-US]MCZ3948642.1 helix-turn-helix transcriptional regulator [Lactobacillus gasseri]QTH66833.1 helix-turn-helix transcriptional regulator [Lactobacillus gasseri]